MPPAVLGSVMLGTAIAGGATAAAGVYAARKSNESSRAAAAAEMDALDKQLAFEREKEAERKAEWDRAQAEAKAQWEAEQASGNTDADMRRAEFELAKQKYTERQAQMAPYRQVGVGALAQLAGMAGLTPKAPEAKVLDTMPETWQPGDPVVAGAAKAPEAPAAEAPVERPAFLENPQILPASLPVEMTPTETTPAEVAPTMASAAYQRLATPRSAGMAALTPSQVAELVRAGGGRPLSSLARSRRAAV